MDDAPAQIESLLQKIERQIRGQVRFDRLTRTLYSVDASIYEITPAGVVFPRDQNDVAATVNACREHGVSIVPRGAGTGLAGGAVGSGVVVDCSRFMTEIADVDPAGRTVRVQPGAVLDRLNAAVAPHGLHFAPDVATANRATIGGMIANNSCGAHSIIHGRTVDHVASLTVVLADGSVAKWPRHGEGDDPAEPRATHIERELQRIAEDYRDEVQARFPKILRNNAGYALDRIGANAKSVNPATIICGSEGTLGMVTEAVVKLTPLPKCKGMLVVHFADVLDALEAAPRMLDHQPAAVELLDRMVTQAARFDSIAAEASRIVDMKAPAMLFVEFFGNAPAAVGDQIAGLERELSADRVGYDRRVVLDPRDQRAVWRMRERGLGILMSKPGDQHSHAFVEDSAVDPKHLRDYIERFAAILKDEGIRDTSYYAHAGAGVIHVRPVLNLKTAEGVVRLQRIADRVSSLALEFHGTMTGEHGDGIVRSGWLEKMYGPKIVQAFREVKRAFDPDGLFNPGKIVDPLPLTQNLRYGPNYESRPIKTYLNFDAHHGMAGLAEMCSGIGECRKRHAGTMCPSYIATADEKDTTRARAIALRSALSNRGLINDLNDPALDGAMDLCLSCKACKSECPTGVDMAKLKAEWLSAKNMRQGVPRAARFVAEAAKWARRGSRYPRLANLMLQSRPARFVLERWLSLDRRMPPPRLATHTFHHWFRRHRERIGEVHVDRPAVVYFADTWTNFYTPQVGVAAVKLLEAAGFRVLAPRFECCGRPMISKGMLTEAKHLAELNVERMASFADRKVPIIGTEPSCILTLIDEYPQLVRSVDAAMVADIACTIETFLARILRQGPDRLRFNDARQRILYHGHCHQKALIGTRDAMAVLNHPPGFQAHEIDSGCCGMAGAFGHERDHYEVAKAIGEERLFPAVRNRGGAIIAVSGFSCRHQLAHHLSVSARHPVELLADALCPNP